MTGKGVYVTVPALDSSEALLYRVGVVKPPWAIHSYQLISLLDMQIFYSDDSTKLLRALENLSRIAKASGSPESLVTEDIKVVVLQFVDALLLHTKQIGLRISVIYLERMKIEIPTKLLSYKEISDMAKQIQARIEDEMSAELFLHIFPNKASYYQEKDLFGPEVSKKFPRASFDIEEAGKCLATNRNTACIFHLMRVMELGVQSLGRRLGVKLVGEKVWQNILNEVNKAIKEMGNPPKPITPKQKVKRDKYAAVAAHLENVKNAWRNRVMHPKDQYADEEAE